MQIISQDQESLVARFTQYWCELAHQSIEQRGYFHVGLSGGNSPKPFLNALQHVDPALWQHTYVYQIDDRFVPHDHVDSNWGMLKRELLDHVCVAAAYPMVRGVDLDDDVASYEKLMHNIILDLAVLGVGHDGHTASLFPEQDLGLMMGVVSKTTCSYLPHQRITLTLPKINQARHAIFLVLGDERVPIIKEMLSGESLYPAARVTPLENPAIVFTDASMF